MHGAAHAPRISGPIPSNWTPSRTGDPAAGRPARPDRFALVVGLGTTILIAVVFTVVVGMPKAAPLDESQPAGVTHNYYLALTENDLGKAYGYLSLEARAVLP